MIPKVAILIPGNPWFCPYVGIYTRLFDEWNIPYEIIYWNRGGEVNDIGIPFNAKTGNGRLSKFIGYFKFAKFIKNQLSKNKYSKVVVFSSQIGIFCVDFLKKHYQGNYIFDFRDLSIEQSKLFRHPFDVLLKSSYANVISSPGFKDYLPSGVKYILSHNFIEEEVKKALDPVNNTISTSPIDILTIGGIRDYESNAPLMDVLGNNKNFTLRFIGKGPSALDLEKHAKDNDYSNVFFKGYYNKCDEPEYVKSATCLNIYYPDKTTHKTALSNRFYNSLIYRRPMLVTKGQIQGDYCEKYNVGIAISNIESAPNQIQNWFSTFDYNEYENSCIALLKQFLEDYDYFRNMLKSFCNKK